MASSPITSWEIDEETMETVADFILRGSKITADGGCSHEIKRLSLLGKKVMFLLQEHALSITVWEGLIQLVWRMGTRYDGELREPLVWRQGSQVSMCVARGSALLLSSYGRGI